MLRRMKDVFVTTFDSRRPTGIISGYKFLLMGLDGQGG